MERHRGAERFVNVDRKNEKRYVRALTEKGKKEGEGMKKLLTLWRALWSGEEDDSG